ncbi:HAD family hydrolase [Bacillus carboniphilus]|uniref:HAD family hydrolase n=1 Tax=Bacillus carboniphilus TaxID=86663 RepID=A0ABN0W7D6_9BACI
MEAVIFDFDGTIMDTESLWYEVYRDTLLEEYKYSLKIEDFSKVIGTVDDLLMDQLKKEIGEQFDRDWLEKLAGEEFKRKKDILAVREGIMELIRYFQEKGYKLAIASSSRRKWIQLHLEAFQLTSYFPIIVSSDDVERVKPDPELYVKALEKLNVRAVDAMAIEDSGHGATAAIGAGIRTFVVPNPVTAHLKFPVEASVFEDFWELLSELNG